MIAWPPSMISSWIGSIHHYIHIPFIHPSILPHLSVDDRSIGVLMSGSSFARNDPYTPRSISIPIYAWSSVRCHSSLSSSSSIHPFSYPIDVLHLQYLLHPVLPAVQVSFHMHVMPYYVHPMPHAPCRCIHPSIAYTSYPLPHWLYIPNPMVLLSPHLHNISINQSQLMAPPPNRRCLAILFPFLFLCQIYLSIIRPSHHTWSHCMTTHFGTIVCYTCMVQPTVIHPLFDAFVMLILALLLIPHPYHFLSAYPSPHVYASLIICVVIIDAINL